MEKRDIFTIAKENRTKVPDVYDLSVSEMVDLLQVVKRDLWGDGPYDAILTAYTLGFTRGNRCTINRGMKKL